MSSGARRRARPAPLHVGVRRRGRRADALDGDARGPARGARGGQLFGPASEEEQENEGGDDGDGGVDGVDGDGRKRRQERKQVAEPRRGLRGRSGRRFVCLDGSGSRRKGQERTDVFFFVL